MESNLLLEQYSRYKKIALKESQYSCLLNAHIDPNPHQVNAFCAAVQALKTGGIILADEDWKIYYMWVQSEAEIQKSRRQ